MSYIYLQEAGEVSSAECFSDIPACVLSKLMPIASESCSKGSGMESCQNSQSGMTCEHSMDGRGVEKVDVVCGGFPCQDISIGANAAGGGKGISGARSGLWAEMARIICDIQPRIVFVENSPMLTSRGLGRVLGDLAGMGFNAKWGMFCASDTNRDHCRKRIFIYANADKDFDFRKGASPDIHYKNRATKKNLKKWNTMRDELVSLGIASRVESYSDSRGIFYGMADGMDRFEAIGNGQVPEVVELAWKVLSCE